MVSISPSISSVLDWQLEEQMMIHDYLPFDDLLESYNIHNETHTSHNSTSSPQPPESGYEDIHERVPSSSKNRPGHNEYERDRRKKLNKLYSSLRDLLPDKDQNKKLSIPCTVARVLRYIPELQRHIKKLIQKKEELLLRVSKDEFASTYSDGAIKPVISATCLNADEIMIQLCTLTRSETIPFSKVADILERRGLNVVNATTHTTQSDRTFYSLHLQAKETVRLEGHILCEQLTNSLSEHDVGAKILR